MSNQNSKKALVIVTDGSEEIETVVSSVYFYDSNIKISVQYNFVNEFLFKVSVLRRAQIDVTVAGITLQNENYAKCNRGVKIVPDQSLSNIPDFVRTFICSR
jgi:hypothetical protein